MSAPGSRSEVRRLLALAGALALCVAASAKDVSGQPWHFTLPTLDGDRFVSLADVRGPVLVNFWGRDCPPCIAELPRLQAFARQHAGWTVLLVSTDAPEVARAALARRGVVLPALRMGANVKGLMREAGNTSGGLPYSVAVRSGRICRAAAGEVSDELLAQWRHACEG